MLHFTILLVSIGLQISLFNIPVRAQDTTEFNPSEIAPPTEPPIAQFGRSIYTERCASCHGLEGNSDGTVTPQLPEPPPRFTDPETVWEHSPAEYFHIIKFGRLEKLMPPWNNSLSDEEIWQALYYAWSLHTDAESVQAGAELYQQAVESESEAAEELPDFSDLASMIVLSPAELAQQLQDAYPIASQTWSDQDQQHVTDYLRTLNYIPPWESAYRAGGGVITGQVIQGTADGGSVAGLTVTLSAFIEFEPAATFEATTDDNGRFEFTELSTDEGVVYVAEVNYLEIPYRSDIFRFEAEIPEIDIEVSVFETSDDPSGIRISRVNWIIDYEPGVLVIGQILAFGNQQDRTFIGRAVEGLEMPVTTQLVLPDDAFDIQFRDGILGGRFHQVDQFIYDTAPIAPGLGSLQMLISFRIEFPETSAELSQEFLYPLDSMNLLIAEIPGQSAEVSVLEFSGSDEIQGSQYRLWSGDNLEPQTFNVRLEGLIATGGTDPRGLVTENEESQTNQANASNMPTPSTPPLSPQVPIAVGTFLLVILTGVLYIPLRQQQATDPQTALMEEKETLLQKIAQLDDQYEQGELAEEEWSHQRARLKSRLLDVASQLAVQKETAVIGES